MVFYSKKGRFIVILNLLVVLVNLLPIILQLFNRQPPSMVPSIAVGIVLLFLIWTLISTRYEIRGDGLLIVRSTFLRWRIPISSIRTLRKTRNPMSAPALSLDRLEIVYEGCGGFILVSPQQEERFVQLLREQNPHIIWQ